MSTSTTRQQQETKDENQTHKQRITTINSDPFRQGYIELDEFQEDKLLLKN